MNPMMPNDLLQLTKENADIALIDVRTPAEFGEVHLDCARNIPLDRLNPKVTAEENGWNEDSQILFICKSGSRGKMACEKFAKSGFKNVVNIEGGTEACLSFDFNVARGRRVISLDRQVRIAAGFLVLLGVALGFLVHPGFFGLSGFVGAGLMFAGITDTCGMGMLISRMPWNQAPSCSVPPASSGTVSSSTSQTPAKSAT